MQPDQAERVAEIVERVLEGPKDERTKLIADLCGDDGDLRREVESLLRFQAEATDFIEKPAYEVAAESLVGVGGELRSEERLGDYRIISLIGEGGMGEVYLAEDTSLGRKVAIKLLKFGLGTSSIIRRFEQEERILASLIHPNIAQLYGGAVTANGLPYFVMEYVQGERLDDYCLEHHLPIGERLDLFRKICSAVAYAHQHLVVHRDIKPANIRVTADGEPKLLDFGIAKLLDPAGASIEATMTFAAVMTPEYASPEQVRGENITTGSDIYSLGVVLYELLTNQKPYKIDKRTPTAVARAITEQEPTRPSTAIARSDGTSKSQISNPKLLRGDLDNIVLKALRKEPERRYGSVAQFSEDIRRYIEGRPVSARKDAIGYRTSKFIARNKIAVSAAVLILLTIIGGSMVALWEAQNARHQRDVAQRINTFLQQMLSFSNQSVTSVWPVAQKRDVTVNQMLDLITPQVTKELGDQPDVRGQILRTIGSAYASLGQYDAAEKNFRAALKVQTTLYGENDREVADTMLELGVLSFRQQKYEEAGQLLERVRAVYSKLRQLHSREYSAAKAALASDYLAAVKLLEVDPFMAMPLFNEALQIASTANLQGQERGVLAGVKSDTGAGLLYIGELEKGEALLREALSDWHQIPGLPRWEQAANLTMLGIAALRQNRLDDAEKHLRNGEQLYRQTLGDNNYYLAMNLNAQGDVLFQKNDLKAAEEKAKYALAMIRDFSPDNKFAWATPMRTLGDILTKAGRARESEDYLRQALAIFEEQPKKNHSVIASTKIKLSQSLAAQDRLAEAEKMARDAYDEVRQNLGAQHPALRTSSMNLAQIYEKEGKHDLAKKLK